MAMRSQLKKQLRSVFAEHLLVLLPFFKPKKIKTLSSGAVAYSWQAASDLTLYIVMDVYHNQDQFTIEVAWSENNELPDSTTADSPTDDPRHGKWCMRLCSFWTPKDVWWELAPKVASTDIVRQMEEGRFFDEYPLEQAMSQINPKVLDVVERIKLYALPYFKKIVDDHGYTWPSIS
jgi:hypothetical protein